jgi:hypothetical protein
MKSRWIASCSLVAFVAVAALSVVAIAQSVPQNAGDLSGVWEASSGPRRSIAEGSAVAPSMTASGKARFDANKPSYGPRAIPPALGNDPIGECNPLGVPRILLAERPMEIIQLPGRVLQFVERPQMWRTIWTDGRKLPEDPDPAWYGYSVGRWEGDTLFVETIGVDERTWLDQFGYPHSGDMRVEERWRRVNRDTLELKMTIDDPKTYSKPVTIQPKLFKLQPKGELRSEPCAPIEEESFNRRIRNPAAGLTGK